MNRRDFLKTGVAAGTLATMGLPAFAQQAVNLRLYWWGSQDRSKRTIDVADAYMAKNPGIKVAGEAVGADYWPKLSTMMAGRNLPDVVQFEPSTLADYARRGTCLALDQYIPNTIKTAGLAENVLDLTRVDGKTYGVALGVNSFSTFYDTEAFSKAGIQPPKPGQTWDQYADMAVELTKANNGTYWGAPYGARYNYVFDVWLHQRGKSLFTEDGKLGFNVDDAKEWYDYWEKLRARNGCVPADVQSLDQSLIDSNALTLGKAATAFTFSNQLIGYQSVVKKPLAITTLPVAQPQGPSGLYYRPALIWCIGSTSKNPEAAARFIDFFVNDPEAGKILGVERGVPPNLEVRRTIQPTVDELARQTIAYVDLIAGGVAKYPPPPPVGSNEFDHQVMRPTADQLAFGRIKVAEAAERLVKEGTRVIRA